MHGDVGMSMGCHVLAVYVVVVLQEDQKSHPSTCRKAHARLATFCGFFLFLAHLLGGGRRFLACDAGRNNELEL